MTSLASSAWLCPKTDLDHNMDPVVTGLLLLWATSAIANVMLENDEPDEITGTGKQASPISRSIGSTGSVKSPASTADTVVPTKLPEQPSCPCVKPPGAAECVSYNPGYQAATLEEAISNFYDANNPANGRRLNPQVHTRQFDPSFRGNGPLQCKSNDVQCQKCLRKVLAWFQAVAEANGDNSTNEEVAAIQKHSGVEFTKKSLTDDGCPYLDFLKLPSQWSGQESKPVEVVPVDDGALNDIVRQLKGDRDVSVCPRSLANSIGLPRVDQTSDKRPRWPFSKAPTVYNSRPAIPPQLPSSNVVVQPRRRGNSPPEDPYQYTVQLECRSRAEAVEPGSEFCALCDTCWHIAYLRPHYFPQIINQVSCGTNRRCLSGYAECRPRMRSVSVLRNYGTTAAPDWKEYTLNVPAACECQFRRDSAIVNLASR